MPGNGSPPSSADASRTRGHSSRTWRCRGSTRELMKKGPPSARRNCSQSCRPAHDPFGSIALRVMVNVLPSYILDEAWPLLNQVSLRTSPTTPSSALKATSTRTRSAEEGGGSVSRHWTNGILSCDDPRRLQEICDGFSPERSTPSSASGLAGSSIRFADKDRHAEISLSALPSSRPSFLSPKSRSTRGRAGSFFEEVIARTSTSVRPDKRSNSFFASPGHPTPPLVVSVPLSSPRGVVPSLPHRFTRARR